MSQYKIVMYNTEGTGTAIEEKVLRNRNLDSFKLIRIDGNKDEEFLKEAADADGVIVVYVKMDEKALGRLNKCRIIATHSIGVNNIDLAAATKLGICVGNVPDYCIEEVAVHSIALLLNCIRKVTRLDCSVRSGAWDAMACGNIYRTKGKTLGFVSFGNIPQRIAELLRPYGMRIIAYDPFVSDDILREHDIERIETLEDLFGQSDYISVHTPLTPRTRHMIGRNQFNEAKGGAVIVCTGRGGVIDEDALKEAVLSGKVESAGIDVIEDEINGHSVLMGLEEVVITPHSAYYSEDSIDEVRIKAMEQIIEVLEESKLPKYLVNKTVSGQARFQKKL